MFNLKELAAGKFFEQVPWTAEKPGHRGDWKKACFTKSKIIMEEDSLAFYAGMSLARTIRQASAALAASRADPSYGEDDHDFPQLINMEGYDCKMLCLGRKHTLGVFRHENEDKIEEEKRKKAITDLQESEVA